jgi:hypothetical protein
MTTFTTEDRILAEKDGSLTFNVEPIPFAGWISKSPPHIVDSGASVMNNEPVAWMSNDSFEISTMQSDKFSIPLYTSPRTHDLEIAEAIGFDKGYKAATAKTLTDEEINDLIVNKVTDADMIREALRKAQEK